METLSKNALLRQENNKPITDEETKKRSLGVVKGKMISSCLQAWLDGNITAYESYSDKIKEVVQTIYRNAVNDGNIGFMGILLDRGEGKVKEEIDMTTRSQDIAPDQDKEKELDDKFKNDLFIVEATEEKETDIVQAAQDQQRDVPDFKSTETRQ